MPDAQTETGPDLAPTKGRSPLRTLNDSYIVILATLGPAEIRREAALVAVDRGLWLAARPERHARILNDALTSPADVREAA